MNDYQRSDRKTPGVPARLEKIPLSKQKPARELAIGAVVRDNRIIWTKRMHPECRERSDKGVVVNIHEAPPEHPTWGRSYRVVSVRPSRSQPGERLVESRWASERDLVALGRVKRLPRSDEAKWGLLPTVDRLSLAPGNRVRVAGTSRCGTVTTTHRTSYTGRGHRAVVTFDDGGEEEFFGGRSEDGRRLVRGGCGPDLIDPTGPEVRAHMYFNSESTDRPESQATRLLAEKLHLQTHREPRVRRIRYSTAPHARCPRAGYCVEHEAIPDVEPCLCGAR